jgi:hypothetical protein
MWMTTDGERPLTNGEWACMRLALQVMNSAIERHFDRDEQGLVDTGITQFDRQTSAQKLAMLARISSAMGDPNAPSIRLTAIVEATVAALLQTFWSELEIEIAFCRGELDPNCEVRRLMLSAFDDYDDEPIDLPDVEDDDRDNWELLFMNLESRFLADYDFALESALDADPDKAAEVRAILGIDTDYFVDTAPDPVERDLIKSRQALARLLGEPVPNDKGLYVVPEDRYLGVSFGPCTDEQLAELSSNPWIELTERTYPRCDCEYEVWKTNFKNQAPPEKPGAEIHTLEFMQQRVIRRRQALTSLGVPII